MKIKKDDTVMVIAGADKGKKGKVLRTYPKDDRVVVEGVNVRTKHKKQTPTQRAEIEHIECLIHVSNVMYYDQDEKEATRIGYGYENKQKIRFHSALISRPPFRLPALVYCRYH